MERWNHVCVALAVAEALIDPPLNELAWFWTMRRVQDSGEGRHPVSLSLQFVQHLKSMVAFQIEEAKSARGDKDAATPNPRALPHKESRQRGGAASSMWSPPGPTHSSTPMGRQVWGTVRAVRWRCGVDYFMSL